MSFYISLQSENQPQNSTEMSWGVVLQGFVFDQMTLIQLCGNQLLCRIPFGSWLWFQLTDMGRHVMWALCVTCCLLRFSITSSLGAGYGFSPCPKMELCSAGTAIAGYDTAGVPPNMEHNWGKKKSHTWRCCNAVDFCKDQVTRPWIVTSSIWPWLCPYIAQDVMTMPAESCEVFSRIWLTHHLLPLCSGCTAKTNSRHES